MVGWNARMDGIQAAILSVKLRHLEEWNALRRLKALLYEERLGDTGDIDLPVEAAYARHVYHIYAIRVDGRDRVRDELNAMDVQCGIHYPIPLHRQKAYEMLQAARLPVTEYCAESVLSLPMYAELKEEQIDRVCGLLKTLIRTEKSRTEAGLVRT
jgi:dTDP-4-amino-4,6-dideoxygalactose transaminase